MRDLYSCDLAEVTEAEVRDFVDSAIAARVQAESLILEFKTSPSGTNVVEAVAAMANTDGGLVVVGVAETGDRRYRGVSRKEIDQVGQQLRSLLPDVVLESMPIALSDLNERAVLLLRIDRRLNEPPIVLNGRVLVRRPGQTVGARRDEVIALVDRTQRVTTPGGGFRPIDVGDIAPWPDEAALEVRVHGLVRLSGTVATQEWFGSDAVDTLAGALESSSIPRRVLGRHLRAWEQGETRWELVELSPLRMRFDAPTAASRTGRPPLVSACIIQLSGSSLETALMTRISPHAEVPEVSIWLLHELLMATTLAALAVGGAAAPALDDPRPAPPPAMSAWVGGTPGLRELRTDRSWRTVGDVHARNNWRSNPKRLLGTDLADADQLARQWLSHLLSSRGILDFETTVEALERPHHLSAADHL